MADATLGALAAAIDRLRCPHCHASLTLMGQELACARGHRYDVARDGHVSLLGPRQRLHTGDTAEMVAAREAFLGAGHYAPIAGAIAASVMQVGARAGGCVVDLGAGTGYHLAALLEPLPGWSGLALDASRPALRRAVRAHPRIAAVACDVWEPLPICDGAADLVLDVFAPRNGPEIARILAPRAGLVVVTPTAYHLHELVAPLGMLGVGAAKQARLHETLAPHLRRTDSRPLEFELALERQDVRTLVAMGPTAHHVSGEELDRRLEGMAAVVTTTVSVLVETFRRV